MIAGTTCVDFSLLNTKKQAYFEGGESTDTFFGMMLYVIEKRPPVVIVENVKNAPWRNMQVYFEWAGYTSWVSQRDTKMHYIPHTRERGYLVAFLRPDSKKKDTWSMENDIGRSWARRVDELERPATATIEDFLLPDDDPVVHRARSELLAKSTHFSGVGWTACIARHRKVRAQCHLGALRPFTDWRAAGVANLPDFCWSDFARTQPERVLDVLDIMYLRGVEGYNYKPDDKADQDDLPSLTTSGVSPFLVF